MPKMTSELIGYMLIGMSAGVVVGLRAWHLFVHPEWTDAILIRREWPAFVCMILLCIAGAIIVRNSSKRS